MLVKPLPNVSLNSSPYGRAARDFFAWCETHELNSLVDLEAVHIAAYIEQMTQLKAAQTVKQHLAAIKAMFDFLVTGGVLTANPASAVRGPRYSTKKGKTPILLADDARKLIRSIPTDTLSGLRDRAIIATMTYSFARVSVFGFAYMRRMASITKFLATTVLNCICVST